MRFNVFGYTFEFYNVRRHASTVYGLDFPTPDRDMRPFAMCDFHSIVTMITNRMNNVKWHSEKGDPASDGGGFLLTKKMFNFIDRNKLAIIFRLIYDGYVDINAKDVCLLEKEQDRKDYEILDKKWIVRIYDDIYLNTGKKRAELLKPQLDMLDTINNADLNLIDNYGAMGILSPENTPHDDGFIDDDEYKKLQEDYHKTHGVRFGKWSLLVTRKSVKYQPIELPIKALELQAKRKSTIASILQSLDIPKELHALFESAKFLNMQEAERTMYSSAVTQWCNVMVNIMNAIYYTNAVNHPDEYPKDNSFWYEFVGVPALQESQHIEWERNIKAINDLMDLRSKVSDEQYTYITKRINDLIDTL